MLTPKYRNIIETMTFEDSFSPLLHRIDHAIRWRAINPNEPVPPPPERLTKLAQPPEELQERAKKYLNRLVAAADVKKGTHRTSHEVDCLSYQLHELIMRSTA